MKPLPEHLLHIDPAKCRVVDPALAYDSPGDCPKDDFDAMPEKHRSPGCKCHEFPIDAELKPDSKPEVDTRTAFEAWYESFSGIQGNREQLDDFWRLARSEDGKGYEDHLIKVLGCWEAWQARQGEIDQLKQQLQLMAGWEKIAATNGDQKRELHQRISGAMEIINSADTSMPFYEFAGQLERALKGEQGE